MSVLLKCQNCGFRKNVPDKYAGKRVKCPRCKKPVRIEELDDLRDQETLVVGGFGNKKTEDSLRNQETVIAPQGFGKEDPESTIRNQETIVSSDFGKETAQHPKARPQPPQKKKVVTKKKPPMPPQKGSSIKRILIWTSGVIIICALGALAYYFFR